MKIFKLLATTAAFAVCSIVGAAPIKIACVGDDFTYGDRIRDRANDSYPAQLGKILGQSYQVRSFASSSTTAQKNSSLSFWSTYEYSQSLKYNPNIVIITLGTNDATPKNWKNNPKEFEKDLEDFIDSYQKLSSKPKVYICLPAPTFTRERSPQTRVLKHTIRPIIEKVAKAKGVKVIDIYDLFEGQYELFPDNLHPNETATKIIAQEIAKSLDLK